MQLLQMYFFNNKYNKKNKFTLSEIHERRRSTNNTNLARQQYFLERRMILLWNFTTRPCRSVSFRCYDEKYYVPLPPLVWNSVALPWTKWFARSKNGASSSPCSCNISCYYVPLPHLVWNSVAYLEQRVFAQQRRAESPIGIQPRAAPWVTLNQVISALKEQQEGTNEHCAGSFCAYSAPIS